MDVSNKYVQLNTQLTTEQATVIPAMNGRQGDNNRQVFFQANNGNMPRNINGETVQLAVNDSKGVPKVLSGTYTVENAAIGRFSLMIPWNFYQAAGDSVQGFIRFLEGDTVVSSIPIQYTVYQNRITFTQTESKAFLSDVDKMVEETNAKFEPIEQKLAAAQTASKILTDSVDSLNESIDKNKVALKNVDNTFTGNNTFDKDVTVTGALHATADNAKHADLASTLEPANDQAVNKLDVNGPLFAHGDTAINKLDVNGDTVVNKVDVNGTLLAHGDTAVNKLDVNGPLFAHGDLFVDGRVNMTKVREADAWDEGLNAHLIRVGNVVMARLNGGIIKDHPAFTKMLWDIPAGFRPVGETDLLASVGYSKGMIKVFPDGSAWNIETAFHTENNNGGDGVPYGFGCWVTTDGFPA